MNKHIYKNCEEISKNIDIKSFKNKTILITGANGLIGGFIAEFLYYLNLEHNSNIKIILFFINNSSTFKFFPILFWSNF